MAVLVSQVLDCSSGESGNSPKVHRATLGCGVGGGHSGRRRGEDQQTEAAIEPPAHSLQTTAHGVPKERPTVNARVTTDTATAMNTLGPTTVANALMKGGAGRPRRRVSL